MFPCSTHLAWFCVAVGCCRIEYRIKNSCFYYCTNLRTAHRTVIATLCSSRLDVVGITYDGTMAEQGERAHRNDRQQQQQQQKQKQHDDLNRGPLTGIRIKPFGTIPTRESGFEDLDGFWSPSAVDHSTPATERIVRRVQQAKENAVRKENKKRDLEKQLEQDVQERITIQLQSTVQGTPVFSPSVGEEEASPPTTTPKWRPAGETSDLTPVSLGSYTTPKRIDATTNISTNTEESDDVNTAVDFTGDGVEASQNRDKRGVEQLTSTDILLAQSPARPSHHVETPSASERIYSSSKQVVDADTNRPMAYSPEMYQNDDEDDDAADALDDLLASSKKARERQLSLANKLKTPSPSGFTTASEISKTPKSVSFADRIETTFDNSLADNTDDMEIHKDDKNSDSGEELVEDYTKEGSANNFESSSIMKKHAMDKEHIVTVANDDWATHFDVDDGNDSEGDGPAFQMMQNDDERIHEDSKGADSDMEETNVDSASNHSAKKINKSNQQKSVKRKATVANKGKQNQKNTKDKKLNKRRIHVVEEDNQEQTPGQGQAPKQQQYKVVSVDHYKDNHSEDEERGLRRSKRAKFPPLKWWKNERLIFESGDKRESFAGLSSQADIDMPVVTKVVAALPTPAKPRSATKATQNKNKKSDGRKRYDSDSDSVDKSSAHPNQVPFDSTRLRSVSYHCYKTY